MACTRNPDRCNLLVGFLPVLVPFLFVALPTEASPSFQNLHAARSVQSAQAAAPIAKDSNCADCPAPQESAETQARYRTLGTYAAGASALILYANKNWWGDGFDGTFRTNDEGWFGQNTTHGGTDKLGHAFSNYLGTRLFARLFEWAGNDEGTALKLSAASVLGTFTAVEVLDGFTDRWKFSKEDALMNALGAGLAIVMETNPNLDRLLDFRFQYRYSEGSRRRYDPFGDYSGQTYLMATKASGVPGLRERSVLRYLELAVGYGSRGYHLDSNVPGDRSRNIYYGVSINLSELLDQTVFRGSARKSQAQRAVNGFLEVLQVPGTAALTHRRQ